MNVGQRIRETREDLGMPQTVLARRVGVARNTIGRYESGEHEPSFEVLEKIARELRTEPAEFLREPVPLDDAPQEEAGRLIVRTPHSSLGVSDEVEAQIKERIKRHLNAAIYDLEAYRSSKQEAAELADELARVRDKVLAAL
jgi:transcriptional regulator with XRE-family HTH domain